MHLGPATGPAHLVSGPGARPGPSRGRRLDSHPGVDGERSVGRRDHRVEVELDDLAVGVGEGADAQHDSLPGRRGRPARCPESRPASGRSPASGSSRRVADAQRADSDRDVAEQLDRGAAGSAGDDRAEDRVGRDPDQQLDTLLGHSLDEEGLALDARPWPGPRRSARRPSRPRRGLRGRSAPPPARSCAGSAGPWAFSARRPPSCAAASPASSGSRAVRDSGIAMP